MCWYVYRDLLCCWLCRHCRLHDVDVVYAVVVGSGCCDGVAVGCDGIAGCVYAVVVVVGIVVISYCRLSLCYRCWHYYGCVVVLPVLVVTTMAVLP